MSTDKTLLTVSTSSDDTEQLGARLGKRLKGGEVIELVSDLGGGKTTFVRGLARGANSKDHVASPSFTISKVYKAPNFTIHHFDFHRLQAAGILEHELSQLLKDRSLVIVIEWADAIRHVLPQTRLTIKINSTGLQTRQFNFICAPELSYLLDKQ